MKVKRWQSVAFQALLARFSQVNTLEDLEKLQRYAAPFLIRCSSLRLTYHNGCSFLTRRSRTVPTQYLSCQLIQVDFLCCRSKKLGDFTRRTHRWSSWCNVLCWQLGSPLKTEHPSFFLESIHSDGKIIHLWFYFWREYPSIIFFKNTENQSGISDGSILCRAGPLSLYWRWNRINKMKCVIWVNVAFFYKIPYF